MTELRAKQLVGRPQRVPYSPEVASAFCARVAEGELVTELCRDPQFPSFGALHRWREEHPEFREQYARARQLQAHALADRAVMTARAATPKTAHSARLKYDAERWLAARLDPTAYGDRVEHVHEVGDKLADRLSEARRRLLGVPTIDGAVTGRGDTI